MGSTYNTLLTEPLLGETAAQYDPTKLSWIGSITTQYNACMVWHTSSIKTIKDARRREVRVATTGLTGNSAKMPLMLNALLGTKFEVVAGYTSSGMRLAVERGEVEGICGLSYDSYQAANPEWLRDKKSGTNCTAANSVRLPNLHNLRHSDCKGRTRPGSLSTVMSPPII